MKKLNNETMICLRDHEELMDQAAEWFHQKWGIPKAAYLESMKESLHTECAYPNWYIMMDGERIVAGHGVIANDFHERKDLTPNVCAVYVEEDYRCQGIAGHMLEHVSNDFKNKGISTLYLITDHTSFYERYGWEYLFMVKEDDSTHTTRMYRHEA